MKKSNQSGGFTLLEILIVIAIIAILATIVLIAIDPAKRFREANNSSRQAHVNTIMDAIGLRIIDLKGTYATSTCVAIATTTAAKMASGAYDIATCLVPDFIGRLPVDPKESTDCSPHWTSAADYDTCYTIIQDPDSGRITITASNTEKVKDSDPAISVTR